MKHFLLSYLKTLNVGPAGFEPAASRLADRRLSNWANWAAANSFKVSNTVLTCSVVFCGLQSHENPAQYRS